MEANCAGAMCVLQEFQWGRVDWLSAARPAVAPYLRLHATTSRRRASLGVAQFLGGGEDGGERLHVAGAAADDAGECFADVGIGRGRVFVEQFFRGEDQTGGA